MSDPGPNLNSTLVQAKARLTEMGVPEAKHDAKLADAGFWWKLTGLCIVIAVLCLGGSAAVVARVVMSQGDSHLSVPVLVVLAGPGVLAAGAALYCASQADGEATRAFLASLPVIRGFFKNGT